MSAGRVLGAFLVARAVFGIVFLAQSLGRLPVLLYFPLEHRFMLAVPGRAGPGLAMAWFGATGLALAAAVISGAAAWIASNRGSIARWIARPQVMLGIARAGGLILLVDFAYFGWTMTHQTPSPLPIPAWYCPR